MRIPESSSNGIEVEVVERTLDSDGHQGDFALALRVNLAQLQCQLGPLWVERDAYEAFLREMEHLGQTRQGRACLHFMSPHQLELFAVVGSSDLAVRGRFSWGSYIGQQWMPTELDFHARLDSEYVEEVTAEFRKLVQ